MKTKQEYIDSIKKNDFEVYMRGEKLESPAEHPVVKPSLNSVAETYKLAHKSEHEDLMTATSHLTGDKINRFTHLHRSEDDLIKKVKMQRLLGQKTGTCFQRCVGMDALNALDSVTYEMDQKFDTDYHEKFEDYLKYVQKNDLVIDGAMTDPKGDRSKRPHQQEDSDMYLRVIEENKEGIIVRGAKLHQTGAINSHEIIVMPTCAMKEEDENYAVSFALPSDSDDIFYIYGRQSCDLRKLHDDDMDLGNFKFGGQETMIIFDDVFVPWERVFMCGEHKFAGKLVSRFAGYHRQSYGGCKVGAGDVLIGAAAALAEYNGVEGASHIREKLTEMIHLNETIYSAGIACSCEGKPTSSGTYIMDLLLANICKQNVTRFPYEISRLAEDIAGGLMVTMPSSQDLDHEKTGDFVEKYLRGCRDYSTEERMKMMRLVENMSLGLSAVGYRTESLHGAGSPQAQRIMIQRQGNLEQKKKFAKEITGIE